MYGRIDIANFQNKVLVFLVDCSRFACMEFDICKFVPSFKMQNLLLAVWPYQERLIVIVLHKTIINGCFNVSLVSVVGWNVEDNFVSCL